VCVAQRLFVTVTIKGVIPTVNENSNTIYPNNYLKVWDKDGFITLIMFVTSHCLRYTCNVSETGPISVIRHMEKKVPTQVGLFRRARCTNQGQLFPPYSC
jgi:hypothetical protein